MARRPTLEDQLSELHACLGRAVDDATIDLVTRSLASRSNLVVAKACEVAGLLGMSDLSGRFAGPFDRFMVDPGKTDKGCRAKVAIVKACRELSHGDEPRAARGIEHVQMEPVYGGRVDTATELREQCAYWLAEMSADSALERLTDLLADVESGPRAAAARALAGVGAGEAVMLLRYKVRIGDPDADVLAACYGSLIAINAPWAMMFTVDHLNHSDVVRSEAAMLALGAARAAEADEAMIRWFEQSHDDDRRRTALTAMAISRSDRIITFLLDLVRTGTSREARHAAEALSIHRYDQQLTASVREAAESHPDPAVAKAMGDAFGT